MKSTKEEVKCFLFLFSIFLLENEEEKEEP